MDVAVTAEGEAAMAAAVEAPVMEWVKDIAP